MRFGIMLGDDPDGLGFGSLVAETRKAAELGLHSVWMSQIFGFDALTALAVVGREVPSIELGTAVVPIQPRHPMIMAMQALTTQAIVGGRFVLGIGLSHQVVIEAMFGYPFQHPLRRMREYLSVLVPLIREGTANFEGDTVRWNGPLQVPGATACPVLIAALGPQMLRLAAEKTDGTVTWMTGPATIANHVVPTITASAEKAGREKPRVVVGLPLCVTDNMAAARERAAKTFAIYGQLPSYRAMLDREGVEGPGDVAIVGDEDSVTLQLDALAGAGASDFLGAPFGRREERARTLSLLSRLAGAANET